MLAKLKQRIIGPLKREVYEAGINKFFKAVKGGNLPTIMKFINKNNELKYKFNVATITDTNNNGYTALHQACILGLIKVVHFFTRTYKKTIQINQRDRTPAGKTPLHHASERGHKSIVQYLIEDCKALIDLHDKESKCTPFLLACKRGRIQVIRYYVNECKLKKKCNIAAVDKDGWNALHYATMSCNLDTVVFITRNCSLYVPIEARTPKEGYTALHTTVISTAHVASTTKEQNNMRKRNHNTISILHYLIHHCNLDILAQDNTGSTILHHVCAETDNGVLAQYIIERCFMVEDEIDDVKEFEADNTKILRPYRKQRKKNKETTPSSVVNTKDDRDYYNAVHGNHTILKLLDIKNNNNETAMDVAKGYGHDIIAHYLYMQKKMLLLDLEQQKEKEMKQEQRRKLKDKDNGFIDNDVDNGTEGNTEGIS